MTWYSLFSDTGDETESLSMYHTLTTSFTNNYDYQGNLHPLVAPSVVLHSMLMNPDHVQDNSVITLNNYNRTIPSDIIERLDHFGVEVYGIRSRIVDDCIIKVEVYKITSDNSHKVITVGHQVLDKMYTTEQLEKVVKAMRIATWHNFLSHKTTNNVPKGDVQHE